MTQTTISTRWEMRTYDVLGNADDGYEVNDSYSQGEFDLDIETTVNNAGTEHEFISAQISDEQLREVFGLDADAEIDVDGDDVHYYVNAAEDGYPIGELYCVSHQSLSPIREI